MEQEEKKMTVEEAIDLLDNLIGMVEDNHDSDYDTALRMGIMGIKALSTEPCEDAISRQAVKEQMTKYGFHALDMTITEFVEDLPSVTPKQKMGRWIPVSEKLPENIGDYLVTYDYTNFREDFENIREDFENTVGICWWSGKELGCGWQCYLKVVAWMPLPEPYKENEDKK